LVAKFDTGSLDFIQKLVQELYKIGVYRLAKDETTSNYPLTIHKRGKAYEIKIRARESLENLFHYLYDGVDESFYLKRKHETFLRGLTTMPKERSYKRYSKSLKSPCTVMRKERERRGLSQEKVAEAMGISKGFLCDLELGKLGLSWAVWIRWCSALRISPEYVIDRWERMGGFAEIATWQQEKKELSEEEFTVRAIKKLRKKPHKGIHTIYSGFNDAWRKHLGTDPIDGVQKLAQQGKIEIRPAKGGAIIYLPGEGPRPKNVLDMILE